MYFRDRFEAGHVLAEELEKFRDRPDVLVLALPRGGVPVAFEVACELGVPLDIFLVRKLGLPGHEELAMGALANGGSIVLNDDVVREFNVPNSWIESAAEFERQELRRQRVVFRGDAPPPNVKNRVVILVDDGLATGSTMRAAITALRTQQPKRLIAAVPVGDAETCAEMAHEADEVICAVTPDRFVSVGSWYEDFSPVSDNAVRELLREGARLEHTHSH